MIAARGAEPLLDRLAQVDGISPEVVKGAELIAGSVSLAGAMSALGHAADGEFQVVPFGEGRQHRMVERRSSDGLELP
jgi:hypothetical protein